MVQRMLCLLSFICSMLQLSAQRLPDHVYMNGIRTVKLFMQNNQSSMALLTLGGSDQLELHFDDFYGYPRNFYYTYQLCNADWTPADVNPFDYIKGFTQVRLSQYRQSTITESKYIHYQALLPERNCIPAKSGNYLLKVYLDGDTSKLAFTKRMLVVDNRVSIGAIVQQPFDNEIVRTHQKIQVAVNTQQLNVLSPQQTHLVILQNSRWDDAVKDIQPTFIRQQTMEYNAEQDIIFPAGKEYRWADLQSFRFLSDRMDKVDKTAVPNEVYIKPDAERNNLRYLYFQDRNGYDEINSTEFANPWWQSSYARVNFTFVPARNQPYAGRSLYMVGELTGNQIGDTSRMQYDPAKGVYTKTLFLKQGYYSYLYVTRDDKDKSAKSDPSLPEGNYWETENQYTLLFYYRSFSSRYDELVGISTVNSQQARRY